ncbi:MAG: hypothetical protein J6T48_01920 [Bacteroidales bacterium]|nr:hypothetical protein [Bacteroidales bacterium]
MAENEKKNELTVTEKLKNLYKLQLVDSKLDEIKNQRGELPLEVRDLEDEIAGLETRISNYKQEIKDLNAQISTSERKRMEAEALLKRYQEQQNNVRNNREFDALTKEIENQDLDMQLCEKNIRVSKEEIENKNNMISEAKEHLAERRKDLELKKVELENIISETKAEEEKLNAEREEISQNIEPRLLFAYTRIRNNARNKLAVVTIERDACRGCFNKIPPQRQLDIKSSKKIIPCEYCGRILVDPEILDK